MEALAGISRNRLSVTGLVLVALLGATYAETFYWMVDRWLAPSSYYSHGFIVPLVSIWMVWKERQKLAALPLAPSVWGWLFLATGLGVHLVSLFLRVHFTSGVTLPWVIFGAVLFLFGREHARQLRLPIVFSLFMIPLPMAVIEKLAFRLKLIATESSVWIASQVGWATESRGSLIYLPSGETLIVGDVCSGLRSLIALLTLGFLFATAFSRLSVPRRVLLFVLSVPIAVASNVVRLVSLCALGHYVSAEFASGPAHYAFGFGIYIVALGLLFLTERALSERKRPEKPVGEAS
ncbi:MAG: exosortase/archaeosortase family protein [Planctomycetota bacterium]